MRVLLVGNPNAGKTTLFNALTHDHQRVGNWPGVTVEKKSGICILDEQLNDEQLKTSIELIDLPGLYSISSLSDRQLSQDELIVSRVLAGRDFDCIVNVVDASHLERHLYLTSQLLELGMPMVVALNRMDLATARGLRINQQALSQLLGCSVVSLQAHRSVGLSELKRIVHAPMSIPSTWTLSCPNKTQSEEPMEWILADARYQAVHDWVLAVQTCDTDGRNQRTALIDRVVLHRFWAIPLFLMLMYSLFFLAIQIGGVFQAGFDDVTHRVCVDGVAWGLQSIHAPSWLVTLMANGVGLGLNTTLTFIPVMAAMFFLLSALEASGYMARVAFILDKAMSWLGLPGKAFVPLIIGFGCNVPAVMAARTLESKRDRLLTVLMTPFMSCSARLAIYAVFVAAFFQHNGQNVVFSLYVIGVMMALLTGMTLRRTVLKGPVSPLILELPTYQCPSLVRLCRETGVRLRSFIMRAGKLIIPVCAILGALNAYSFHTGAVLNSSDSVVSWIGVHMTPLFAPMGISPSNWPATVGLLMGTLAKEVVVGSLNSLYASMAGGQSIYGVMAAQFDGAAGAYAYLLFILLYIPCVSTMAAIRQETNRRWMWFSVMWSMLVAYFAAVLFYQIATGAQHPVQTSVWILTAVGVFTFVIQWLRWGVLSKENKEDIDAIRIA